MDPRLTRLPNMIFIMLRPGKELPPNTAVFKVPLNCSKPQIANYLEQIYRVRVKKVNTLIYTGKKVKTGWDPERKIKRPDWKKAYVTLQSEPGQQPWTMPTAEEIENMNRPTTPLTNESE